MVQQSHGSETDTGPSQSWISRIGCLDQTFGQVADMASPEWKNMEKQPEANVRRQIGF